MLWERTSSGAGGEPWSQHKLAAQRLPVRHCLGVHAETFTKRGEGALWDLLKAVAEPAGNRTGDIWAGAPTLCGDGTVCILPARGKRCGCLLVCDNRQGELRDDLPKARHKHSSNSLWAGRVGWHLKCFQTRLFGFAVSWRRAVLPQRFLSAGAEVGTGRGCWFIWERTGGRLPSGELKSLLLRPSAVHRGQHKDCSGADSWEWRRGSRASAVMLGARGRCASELKV